MILKIDLWVLWILFHKSIIYPISLHCMLRVCNDELDEIPSSPAFPIFKELSILKRTFCKWTALLLQSSKCKKWINRGLVGWGKSRRGVSSSREAWGVFSWLCPKWSLYVYQEPSEGGGKCKFLESRTEPRVWRTGNSLPPQSLKAGLQLGLNSATTLPKDFPFLKRKQTQHHLSCL